MSGSAEARPLKRPVPQQEFLEMLDSDYTSATKKCDIVMKGGITSGIVYPRAVSRLAREYRFQSIGGTSAGAIAAAVTAAAEYSRA
jgi:predicted acylesterase/phospholipase RssA